MKIAIIGAGYTGLSAAYYLQKEGHDVTVFEKEKLPGGLAIGYQEKKWKWSFEEHYHHWFTNDSEVLSLAREINFDVIVKRPKTSSYVDGGIYQLDSPVSLLRFPKLTLADKIRMGTTLALLRFNPFWKIYEGFTAEPFLKKMMGRNAYKKIWEPLMLNKLGKYSKVVSLAWFWARVYKRTPSLAYPKGGFLNFAISLEEKIKKAGGKFYYETEIAKIKSGKKIKVTFAKNSKKSDMEFDKAIVTSPTHIFTKIAPDLPKIYVSQYTKLEGIGAVNLVLRLKEKFFEDNTYWLNMCDINSPILGLVEHTNFMDKKNYNNEHLLYVGNYMEVKDKRFSMTKKELLKLYDPWLKKINKNYQKNLVDYEVFKAPFAQPIIPINYSKKIPPFVTPLKNVYLANIQQVYPWDRGTNYAVELGRKVSQIL